MVEYLSGNRIQGSSSVGAVDTLGTAVNGTNSGTVTDNNTPFYGDTSVAFDNNDAVHDLGTTSSFAGLIKEDFTVIFWAKASAVGNGGAGSNNGWGAGSSSNTYAGNQGTILNCGQVSGNGSNQGFVISFDDEGSQEFYMWMGDGNGNVMLNDVIGSNDVADTDNNWHLYMFHFDNTNSQVKIYRDGGSSAIQTTSYASQVSSTSSTTYKKMFMGRQADDDARYFIGSLSDVSIWKRLVTTSEFNTLWGTFQDNTSTATNSVKGVRVDALSDQSGLLAHWKLDNLNFTNSASPTDEKTTLTNVPINSRYEEVDTRKIYRRSGAVAPVFEETFADNSRSWNLSSSEVTISGGTLNITNNSSGDDNIAYLDISSFLTGSALPSGWTMRFKVILTDYKNNANGQAVSVHGGVSSNTSLTGENASSTDSAHIKIGSHAATDNGNFQLQQWRSGTSRQDTTSSNNFSNPFTATIYCELKANGTTLSMIGYDNADYTSPNTYANSGNITLSNTYNNYKYVFFKFFYQNVSESVTTKFDDVKIYETADSVDASWKERGVA